MIFFFYFATLSTQNIYWTMNKANTISIVSTRVSKKMLALLLALCVLLYSSLLETGNDSI